MFQACKRMAAIAMVALVAACGGGHDDEPLTTAEGGTVQGRVVDVLDGAPIAQAQIRAGNRRATSDAEGRFTLDGVAPAERVLLYADRAGYVDGYAALPLAAGQTRAVQLRLHPAGTVQQVNADQASVVSAENSPAQLQLPASALVDAETGAAVQGQVRVALTPLDPAADPDRMPGDFTEETEAGVRPIESFGAVKFDLRDGAGRRLTLAPGKTATIRIPLSTRAAELPATIPLYWFDEERQRWVEEGEATLAGTAPDQYYEGSVAHFTIWNADRRYQAVSIFDCAVDQNGQPWADIEVQASGIDYSGTTSTRTDANGNFQLIARPNSQVAVYGRFEEGFSSPKRYATRDVDILREECRLVIPRREDGSGPGGFQPPIIVQEPQDATADEAQAALFVVTAIGSPVLKYQWQRNGVDLPGQDGPVLIVEALRIEQDGELYSVVVSNPYGSVSSEQARLTVVDKAEAPKVLQQPQDQSVQVGARATFSVIGSGTPAPSYQWRRNGVDIAGAITATYETPVLTLADDGARYTVKLGNRAGEVISNEALLRVSAQVEAPTIVTQPRELPVRVGRAAVFFVEAQGTAPLHYQWQRDGVDIEGANEALYQLSAVSAEDDGAMFRVIVSNAAGSVTSAAARLIVLAESEPVDELRLLAIMNSWTQLLQGMMAPLQLVDDQLTMLPPSCVRGAVAAQLDGGNVGAGAQLPSGSHTLSATYTDCTTLYGQNFSGQGRVDYQFAQRDRLNGQLQTQAQNLRNRLGAGEAVVADATVDGKANAVASGGTANGLITRQHTLTPGEAARIIDHRNAMTVNFLSGQGLSRTVDVVASGQPRQLRVEFAKLKLDVDGRDYELDGFYQFDYNAQGIPEQGSGEVRVLSEGVLVGRILGTDVGLVVEIEDAPSPLRVKVRTRAWSSALRQALPGAGLLVVER